MVQGIDLAKNELSKKQKIHFKLLEVAYFPVPVLIAGTNEKVGRQSTKTEYPDDSASCNMLKVRLDTAIVIPRLLLDRGFSRIADSFFLNNGKEAELYGEAELNVFILASIDEFYRNVMRVL